MKLLLLSLAIAHVVHMLASTGYSYLAINGFLCIRTQFQELRPDINSKAVCGAQCSARQLCQAFTLVDGPCQLFVFDRCSKHVRYSSCSRRGLVHVKQQPGLPPGALCPAGYADDFSGTKYKLFAGFKNWNASLAAIDAEPGLVIMADAANLTELLHMADAANLTELLHMATLFTKYSWGSQFVFLGGHQLAGSAEPTGGWFWVKCNISIAAGMWFSGEPNNMGGGSGDELVASISTHLWPLVDDVDHETVYNKYAGALAKCVSPFD